MQRQMGGVTGFNGPSGFFLVFCGLLLMTGCGRLPEFYPLSTNAEVLIPEKVLEVADLAVEYAPQKNAVIRVGVVGVKGDEGATCEITEGREFIQPAGDWAPLPVAFHTKKVNDDG